MRRFLTLCICALLLATCAIADVKVPSVIGSHMVLQRDQALPIWGWADAGEEVTVTFGDVSASATADASGKWSVKLPSQSAGGPHTMAIKGKNRIVLEDILIGDVWVCSGQSNMEWPLRASVNPEKEIEEANYPNIRLFHVSRVTAAGPLADVNADWKACTPQTSPGFSAVAYFFGRKLNRDLDVPIGLIETAWGGTRIEPWTPPEGFKMVDATAGILSNLERSIKRGTNDKGVINPQVPTVLYNGMVHGIIPFGIRGAIWYQGESNRSEGMLYHKKMKALIGGWRTLWGQGDFPFGFVQLAPFRYNPPQNHEMLPKIWEAQAKTLQVKNTGMAVITDIGNLSDIHPRNKQEVGRRLALWALARVHGKRDLVYSGPMYKSMKIEGGSIRITFDHGMGLKSQNDKPLSWFTIAGADGMFVEAQVTIDNDTVVVSNDDVKEPKAVRFGWHQEAEPNLVNGAGLPTSPFRTDDD